MTRAIGRPRGGISPYVLVEPFIEHQGERGRFWLRKPRSIGDRMVIARKGSTIPDAAAARSVIRLDPASAFGTGGHGTTEGCLVALERVIKGGESVLDIGTGTGILAIAAFKLGAARVVAVDIDRAACDEALRNIAFNGVENGVEVIEGGIDSVVGPFDVAAANLRTSILLDLMPMIAGKLGEGGTAILSGILEGELHPFLPCLSGSSLELLEMKRVRGWMTLVAARRIARL